MSTELRACAHEFDVGGLSALHALDAGGYLLLDGSWSPNGRCFAALARYQDRSPTTPYTGDAGLAVLAARGGRPNTFYPPAPCPSSGWALCASNVPRLGLNAPNYVNWTNDGRGLVTLRGLFRTPRRVDPRFPTGSTSRDRACPSPRPAKFS